jgi:hypothetical protein
MGFGYLSVPFWQSSLFYLPAYLVMVFHTFNNMYVAWEKWKRD